MKLNQSKINCPAVLFRYVIGYLVHGGPVSEVGLELTGIKQSEMKQPWQSADALSEPESMHET
jgi:hypothetical protein